jgi:hypothetical protein
VRGASLGLVWLTAVYRDERVTVARDVRDAARSPPGHGVTRQSRKGRVARMLNPAAFFVSGRLRRPLKIGIAKDIKADVAADPNSELKFSDIDQVLAWYTNHVGYQYACSVAGVMRGRPRRCQGRHRHRVGSPPSKRPGHRDLRSDRGEEATPRLGRSH